MVLFRRQRELGGCFAKRKKSIYHIFLTKQNFIYQGEMYVNFIITLSSCNKFSTGESYVYN